MGVTSLHIACFYHDLRMVKMLVQASPICLNAFASSYTGYPIHSALTGAYGGRLPSRPSVAVVRFLVHYPGSTVALRNFEGAYRFTWLVRQLQK